jgi:hypothetical protein
VSRTPAHHYYRVDPQIIRRTVDAPLRDLQAAARRLLELPAGIIEAADQGGRGRQAPQDDLGRPGELQPPGAPVQPAALLAPLVVLPQFRLVPVLHTLHGGTPARGASTQIPGTRHHPGMDPTTAPELS